MSYEPIRSWSFTAGQTCLSVIETEDPDCVRISITSTEHDLMASSSLTRKQFEALCRLGDRYRADGDYVRYRESPEDIKKRQEQEQEES